MNLQKNTNHIVTIDDYSSTAQGVAHIDGLAVFVKGAMLGEKVQIKLVKITKNCAWARLQKIIQASKHRIKPDCPYYKICGGCNTRHMAYSEECYFKKNRINNAMQKIGKLNINVQKFHPARQSTRYRNKAIFPVDGKKIGLFRERSHDVVDIDSCLIQTSEADSVITAVRKWIEKYNIHIVRNVFIRTNNKGEALVCLVVNTKNIPFKTQLITYIQQYLPSVVGIILNINNKNTNVVLGKTYQTIWGNNKIIDKLCGQTYELSVPSFFQINRMQTEILYQCAFEMANLSSDDVVADLYCGIGTITLTMAQRAKFVTGIEIVPEAIENAKKNASVNHIQNVNFLCADTSENNALELLDQLNANVVCVDPPRKGLTPTLIEHINADRVIYVSCNPATLARDLSLFIHRGYVATRLEAIDMFPRTTHVECVTQLEKH